MKLEAEDVFSARKGLIAADRGGGEKSAAFGTIECIAMPMQNRDFPQRRQRMDRTGIGELKPRPTNFLDRPGIDPSAERSGHQLRAETDAKRRPVGGEACP